MAKLDTQTKNVSGVLNFPLKGDEEQDMNIINDYTIAFTAYMRAIAVEWSCIVHWSDPCEEEDDDDSNEIVKYYHSKGIKVPHLHFVYRSEQRARLLTWIYRIANAIGYEKEQRILISVEVCKCFPFAIQYLIHLNHPEKTQYSVENIITNLDKERLMFYLESDGTYIDAHTLVKLVMECHSQTEIILRLGIETYMRFRPVITTIFIECQKNPALLYEAKCNAPKYKKA